MGLNHILANLSRIQLQIRANLKISNQMNLTDKSVPVPTGVRGDIVGGAGELEGGEDVGQGQPRLFVVVGVWFCADSVEWFFMVRFGELLRPPLSMSYFFW